MHNSIEYKLAQLAQGALFVGIDPHKHQHTVCVMTQQAQVLAKFRITNLRPGFTDLLKRCETLCQQTQAPMCLFAIEAGAHYWRNLAYFLEDHQQAFRLVNPLTLKRQREGNDLDRRKNDYRDAQMAAQLLREGKYTWTSLPKGAYAELRRLHLTYQSLVKDVARVRLRLTSALDQLFPEFLTVFKSVDGATALTILRCCPAPATIAALSADAFVQCVRERYEGRRLMVTKVRTLHALASQSVGIGPGAEALVDAVYLWAGQLMYMQRQRQHAEDQLVTAFARFDESKYLCSIYGLGSINGAGLLADIGDIRQYSSYKQLPKLAGIVPTERQSADHASICTPMSKRGRPLLRLVVYRAVVSLLRHNDLFKTYVERLMTRAAGQNPLTKRAAIGAAMNKLLRIVYTLLRRKEMFDEKKAVAA
jgi:transposase